MNLSEVGWAKRRQWIIIGLLSAVGIVLLATIAFAFIYKTPTCTDGKQNQEETGIDCGGQCSRACIADVKPAQVRFAHAVVPALGRTDVIAYVDNPNATAAAHGAHATVEVYDSNHARLATKDVVFDIPAGNTVPVFIDGIVSGSPAVVTQTFFTIDQASIQWVRTSGKPIVPGVQDIAWQEGNTPRVSATLVNPTAQVLGNIGLVAVVFDDTGEAIAASRTLVSTLPSQGTAPVIFTWNTPFTSTPARVEVVPIIPVRAP